MIKTETAKIGAQSIYTLSVYSKPGSAVKLVHEGKVFASMRDSNSPDQPFTKKSLYEMIRKTEQRIKTEHAVKEQHHNQK